MARVSGAARTEALRRKREELDKKLREAEATDRVREKEANRRRSEVAGRIVLTYAAANPESEFTRTLAELLDRELAKPADRTLFATFFPTLPVRFDTETPPAPEPPNEAEPTPAPDQAA